MSLTASERLQLLRSVSIFAGTPDDVLGELCSVLVEVQCRAGAPVFVRGDLGDCLYIVAEGQVRVHDGERTLSMLHSGDVFGEMAALDPEVRSASATPIKDTRLFRLERELLYQVMATRVVVARGIIHVLSERARGNLREMREDFEYLQ